MNKRLNRSATVYDSLMLVFLIFGLFTLLCVNSCSAEMRISKLIEENSCTCKEFDNE